MIEIKNVTKKYKKKKEELLVLDNISYSFDNMIYGVIGESGAGKSTLIKCILRLEKIDSGSIIVNNKDISKMSDKEIANYRNKDIGYIPQDDGLFNNLTAEENVIIPALKDNDNVEELLVKARELLTMFGLKEKMDQKVNNLSGGESKRVAIARALINNPKILLFDEPTDSLDFKNKETLLNVIKQISENRCIIIVTHDKDAYDVCDKLVKLQEHKLFD